MKTLKSLFKPAGKQVELTVTRNCFAGGKQLLVGDSIVVNERTAAELIGSESAIDPNAIAKAERKTESLASLIPPMGTPAPVPADWNGLPDCFAAYHQLLQSGIVVYSRRNEIEKALLGLLYGNSGASLKGWDQIDPAKAAQFFRSGQSMVGEIAPEVLEKQRHLRDALIRAGESCDEWKAANGDELARLKFACSDYLQEKHGELCKAVKQLHNMAFELFSMRVEPLGLAIHKIAQLFEGSSDCVKYCRIDAPGLADRKLAWAEPNESPRYYVEANVSDMARLISNYAQTAAEVASLTKQVKAELAKASKVAA